MSSGTLERSLADKGLYGDRHDEEELAELDGPAVLEQRFHDGIKGRLEDWVELAAERLHESGTPLYLIPGQRRPVSRSTRCSRGERRHQRGQPRGSLPDGRELIGFATANPTPWLTPRELEEDELEERLRALSRAPRPRLRGADDPRASARALRSTPLRCSTTSSVRSCPGARSWRFPAGRPPSGT